jgi:hypothetical protein
MPIIAATSKKSLNEDGPALTSHLTSREDPRRFGHIALKPSLSQSRTGVGDGGRWQACDFAILSRGAGKLSRESQNRRPGTGGRPGACFSDAENMKWL